MPQQHRTGGVPAFGGNAFGLPSYLNVETFASSDRAWGMVESKLLAAALHRCLPRLIGLTSSYGRLHVNFPPILHPHRLCLMLSLAVSMPGSIVIPKLFAAAAAPPDSVMAGRSRNQVRSRHLLHPCYTVGSVCHCSSLETTVRLASLRGQNKTQAANCVVFSRH